MKSIFKIAVGIAALSFAQQSSAAVIRLTGSTAFRGGVHNAVIAMFGGDTNVKITHSGTAATTTSLNAASYATFQGTLSGISGTSTVHCSWSGSATGIAAVGNSTSISYIPATLLPGTNGVANSFFRAPATYATEGAMATETTTDAKFAFSDVYKASTPTPNVVLTESKLAVIPFRFLANEGTTGIANVTAQQARALWGNSERPKSMWTGNPADTDLVIPVGRDNGSGTRITVLAETKYGVVTPVQQWKLTGTADGSGTISDAKVWAVGDGVGSTSPGNGGYASGGNYSALLGNTSASVNRLDADNNAIDGANIPVSIIGYLGASDATAAVTAGAISLTYEGSTYSAANVQNGLYTLWGYLHLYVKSLNTDEGTFKTNLTTQFTNSGIVGGNGVLLSTMNVERTNDGAVVTPL